MLKSAVLASHERVRSILCGLVATAARVKDGDLEAAMNLRAFVDEVGAEIRRNDLPRVEADAAAALRGATNLAQLLAGVGTLVDTMAAVERELPRA